jgi:hypothetical protein
MVSGASFPGFAPIKNKISFVGVYGGEKERINKTRVAQSADPTDRLYRYQRHDHPGDGVGACGKIGGANYLVLGYVQVNLKLRHAPG